MNRVFREHTIANVAGARLRWEYGSARLNCDEDVSGMTDAGIRELTRNTLGVDESQGDVITVKRTA